MEAEHNTVAGGTGRNPIRCPCPSRMPLAAGDKDRFMSDGTDVHSQLDGTGCAGMARCPLPAIWPRYPRPPQILLWLISHFLNMACPRIQEGWPSHGVPQQAP